MTRVQFVMQKDGPGTARLRLHQRRHLAGVQWVDARVRVAGIEHDGGILYPGLHVLIRRVLDDVRELLRVFGVAVLGGPPPADEEVLETNHVEQRIAAPYGAEEIWPLRDRGAHEQATV